LSVETYQSLLDAMVARCKATGEPLRHFVSQALSDALGLDHATLFQVSTTGALVQGVYKGAVTIGELKNHGDFGLGTFEGLDGEMVALDGKFYQVHSDGRITEPPDAAPVPFACVTNFHPLRRVHLGKGHLLGCSGAELEAKMEDLDDLRLAIPETTQFLHADLTQDPSRALEKAERAH
jgi:alpha-acetolactate decarboxylase